MVNTLYCTLNSPYHEICIKEFNHLLYEVTTEQTYDLLALKGSIEKEYQVLSLYFSLSSTIVNDGLNTLYISLNQVLQTRQLSSQNFMKISDDLESCIKCLCYKLMSCSKI